MLKASMILNRNFTIGEIDGRIYGGFCEQQGRLIYGGIYQPDHPSADADGFRTDVLELFRELGPTLMRYPGGNFVSGYNWEDGVGPREKRPVRLDLAYRCIEPNTFGTDEFMKWCGRAGAEPMLTVNLGTRGPADAQRLVEYCNFPGGTELSERRKANGSAEPYRVKVWGLGNEQDDAAQIMRRAPEEYGRLAREAAKMMRRTDPEIEIVACGSTNASMPTWGRWEEILLGHAYDLVDYLSVHRYFGVDSGRTLDYFALPEQMDDAVGRAVAFCDAAKAKWKSAKTLMISIEEWNLCPWDGSYRGDHRRDRELENRSWAFARPSLEEIFTMEDALLTGMLISSLHNHADRVKIALHSESVNVMAPIMTERSGRAWRQTTFHPFALAARHGHGTALRCVVDSPKFDAEAVPICDEVREPYRGLPYLYASGVHNARKGEVVIFAANRSPDESMELEARLEDFDPVSIIEHKTLHNSDLKAFNSEEREEVFPVDQPGAVLRNGALTAELPPASWNMLRVRLRQAPSGESAGRGR